jgi:hypothetical protein
VGLLDVGVGNDAVRIGLRVVGLNDDGCSVDGFRDEGLAVGFVDGLDVGLVVGLNDDDCNDDGFRDEGLAVGFVDGLDLGLPVGLRVGEILDFSGIEFATLVPESKAPWTVAG